MPDEWLLKKLLGPPGHDNSRDEIVLVSRETLTKVTENYIML